ncbi:MAG: hypothetical protein VX392_07415 [Verrucomicrobiota bacterium]|nr:hypothetical protein [Verrucomicrobiota bacterium]
MAREENSKHDQLWVGYSQVFVEMDDLSLARWMAQTLGQLSGHAWRLSHPLLQTYELAAHTAHDRQIWLKGMTIIPAEYTATECCRAPLLPVLSRDVFDVGLVCKHCGETCAQLDDLPDEMMQIFKAWSTSYDKAHSVAHWEDDGKKLPTNYDKLFELSAKSAEKLLAQAGSQLAPALLEIYPAVAWEDQDECLEVRPEDVDI